MAAATPSATSTPRGWLDPVVVHEAEAIDCGGLTMAYGPGGTVVLVMACDDDVHVTHGPVHGGQWVTDVIERPRGIVLRDPQVAIDGDRLHVAVSALAPVDGGCGDTGLRPAGVLVWERTLPDGDWAGPTAIGGPDDDLQSFRVVDDIVHATVQGVGGVVYLRGSTGSIRRTTIPDADDTSLRVGSDGFARIAYTASSGDVRLVTMRDGPLAPEVIHRADEHGGPRPPSLVLAGGNEPFVMWTLGWGPGGCAEPDSLPEFGTYVYADVGGVTATDHLSTSEAATSLTLDIPGGMAYVVITEWTDDQHQTNLYSRPIAGGDWTATELEGDPSWPVMRVDQDAGAAIMAWIDWDGDSTKRLMVMTGQVR